MTKGSIDVTGKVIERLPFVIKMAKDEAEWDAAIRVRQAAYARHLPDLAARLGEREELDFWPDTDVLVALSRLDSGPLGTMRVHMNGQYPLPLEQSVELPSYFRTARLIESTRFAIPGSSSGVVLTNAFFKAFYLYAVHHSADYMVITARKAVDRMYERLMFKDVAPAADYIPMRHVGNVPHRVLFLPVKTLQVVWGQAKHPLYRYFFETDHPGLEVNQSAAIAEETFA
jgi:hypothetical protein